jgi:hypothetical protein
MLELEEKPEAYVYEAAHVRQGSPPGRKITRMQQHMHIHLARSGRQLEATSSIDVQEAGVRLVYD